MLKCVPKLVTILRIPCACRTWSLVPDRWSFVSADSSCPPTSLVDYPFSALWCLVCGPETHCPICGTRSPARTARIPRLSTMKIKYGICTLPMYISCSPASSYRSCPPSWAAHRSGDPRACLCKWAPSAHSIPFACLCETHSARLFRWPPSIPWTWALRGNWRTHAGERVWPCRCAETPAIPFYRAALARLRLLRKYSRETLCVGSEKNKE